MPIPIALQLYTLRQEMAQDFEGTVREVAAIGYAGVETAGFPGTTPAEAAKLFQELRLSVTSAHLPLPLGERKSEVLDTAAALECSRIICPSIPADQFTSVDAIMRACNSLNQAQAVALANGLTLGYHNHWWEFQQVDGRLAFDIFREHLDPGVFFEIDTYWVQTAGVDPGDMVRKLDHRVPLLHIKDGPAVRNQPMVAVGSGVMNIPAIVAEARSTEWLIVELDECATDMLTAVSQSYHYLTTEGLAYGTQR